MGWLSHLEKLIKFLRHVRGLVENTKQNQDDIEYLQDQLVEVGEQLKELMFEVRRMQDRALSQEKIDELRMERFRLQVEVLLGRPLPESENDSDSRSTKPKQLAGEVPDEKDESSG